MNIDQLIAKLKEVKDREGNLEVFACNFTKASALLDENEGDGRFPADWNMPAKFVVIGRED